MIFIYRFVHTNLSPKKKLQDRTVKTSRNVRSIHFIQYWILLSIIFNDRRGSENWRQVLEDPLGKEKESSFLELVVPMDSIIWKSWNELVNKGKNKFFLINFYSVKLIVNSTALTRTTKMTSPLIHLTNFLTSLAEFWGQSMVMRKFVS